MSFLLGLDLWAMQSAAPPDFDDLSKRASAALASNPAEAAILYRQAVALRPEWTEGWFYLGASLFQTNQYAEAQKALQKASTLAPTRGTVWGLLGLSEAETGDSRRALADIRKGEALGLADDPKFVSAVRNRAAQICIHEADFSAAVQQLRPLAKAGDKSPTTIQALGISVLSIPSDPAHLPPAKLAFIEAAGQAAWAFYAQNDAEAGALLQQLTSRYPSEPGVHYLYGLYLLASDSVAARREFGKELHLSPTNAAPRLQIAILDIQAGKPQEASQLAQDALRVDSQNALAHLVMGRALLDEKSFAQAVPEFQAAAKLSPENAEAHLYLEQAYRHLGKSEEARREREEFDRRKAASDPTVFNQAR
ncbi:MAG TPA: tetratricopeptide repeat protein [Bryobacteraceae bacterium]|nr:tetratricopeptide repeat protein [Bryobacteraceae bacterium]